MADNLQKYSISVEFDQAIAKIKKFKQLSENFNNANNSRMKASRTLLAGILRQEKKDYDTVQNAMTAKLKEEAKKREQIEKASATKLYKERQKSLGIEAARRKQAIDNLTKSSGSVKAKDTALAAMLREESKATSKVKSPKADAQVQAFKNEQKRIQALADIEAKLKRNVLWAKKDLTIEQQTTKQNIIRGIHLAKNKKEMNNIVATEMSRLRYIKQNTTELKKQNYLMNRMNSSSKQFMGNMISAFALAAGAAKITRIGQEFESVSNTMLAVSEDSLEAGNNLAFVKDEAYRLGLGLKESAKGFAKMVSARGDMSLEDTKKAFTGISEMSTLLGLRSEESGRAINALQQMMSKGVVSAEELKLQMGEVLPNAIQLMALATKDAGLSVNGTVGEMMDLQKNGALISSKVLPHFAERMHQAAIKNGGLEKALNSNVTAFNRLSTAAQVASDQFFRSGFSEGLTEVFNTLAKFLKDNKFLWEDLGELVGKALKAVNVALTLIGKTLSALGSILHGVMELLGDFSGLLVVIPILSVIKRFAGLITVLRNIGVTMGIISAAAPAAAGGIAGIGTAAGIASAGMATLAGGIAIVAVALASIVLIGEEIAELFSSTGKKTLIGKIFFDDDPKKMKEWKDNLLDSNKGVGVAQPYLRDRGKSYSAPYMQGGNVTIQNQTVVDGQVISESIVKTNTFESAVDRKIQETQ